MAEMVCGRNVSKAFKQCIFEGLLQIFYNENQACNEENFKPKQRFYYSKLTWYNQENCWTNKSFTRLPLRTDDHILEWPLTLPLSVIEKSIIPPVM